jgi:hypothetical protein
MPDLPPIMYRLTDAIRVKRPNRSIVYALTFEPILPTVGPNWAPNIGS